MIRLLLSLALILAAGSSHATDKDFSSWRKFTTGKLINETTAIPPGDSGRIGLYVTLADKWHTYWVNAGDSGAAIRLDFKNGPGVRVKKVDMPPPERVESGPLVSFAYSKEVLFPIEIEIDRNATPGTTARIEVDAEWLVCADVCIPAIDTLVLDVPIANLNAVQPSENFPLFQRVLRSLPRVVEQKVEFVDSENWSRLEVPWTPNREFIDFFPFRGSGVTNKKPIASGANPLTLTFDKASTPRADTSRVGLLISRDNTTGSLEAWQFGEPKWEFTQAESAKKVWPPLSEILSMLLSAFIGGVILNLMPCVFPILSMKLLSLLKVAKADMKEVRRQNLAYSAGVLISFLLIALVLSALRSAGTLVGWGFQLQSPLFLTLLCWLFFALAMNLIGLFEIDFLNANIGRRLTKIGGLWGSFFTGVLAVVVASPCTAPFMGVALGFGLTQATPILVATFLFLGLGLALPYLVITIFPKTLRFLPKPGAWMIRLKQFMAIPMLLTVVWLAWVLQQVAGSFAIGVVMLGAGFLFLAIIIQRPKKILIAATALAMMAMLAYVYMKTSEPRVAVAMQKGDWKPYTPELLASLKGQNIFVNMTADWCLTCKVNEKLVFDDPEIMDLLKKKNIILIMGDWTQRNENITRFLSQYNRVGVPFYVLFSPRNQAGQVLPEVLTKSTFRDWIEKEFP